MKYPTVTIKRPTGEIEIVEIKNLAIINDYFFEKIKVSTKEAGKGEVLNYENPKIEMDYTGECRRCGKRIEDVHNAYRQKEWERGLEITVSYCDTCTVLLKTVGAGEHTVMEDRKGKEGYAPAYKQDFDEE